MLESEIYTILKKAHLSVPRFQVYNLEEAFENIDFFPVVLKIQSSKIVHKSEFGAVKVNISSMEELKKERKEIIESINKKGVDLTIQDSFLVTEMVKGLELFVGVVDDDVFGKVILFGKGGVFLELYKDIAYIDVEAPKEEIIRAINTTAISQIFKSFRNYSFDIKTMVVFIQKVQKFIKDNPDIKEMDFNPVMINDSGLTIVDSRIRLEEPIIKKRRVNRPNFLKNSKVAIIGASSNPNKVGYAIARNSLNSSCELFFVNTKGTRLLGKEIYNSIEDITSNIDTAVITVPASFVLEIVEKLVIKKLKNLIVISAGFKEVGDVESENRLKELASKHNFNIIGPNCLGYYNSTTNLNLTFGTSLVHQGDIGLVSQSGAVLAALMDKAYEMGIGFSHIISTGNMVDIDFADIINMLDREESCKYICIYAEGFNEGKPFLKALRDTKKPIYLFKTGKSKEAQKVAFSHTGNLSGNYRMFEGLIKSIGIKIEDNIEALLLNPFLEVDNILIVTNAGGPASILSDYIIAKGKKLYELKSSEVEELNKVLPFNWPKANPIDIIGDAQSDRYKATLEIVENFKDVELIYLIVTPQFMTDTMEIAQLLYKEYKIKIIPIFLGGTSFNDSMAFLNIETINFYTTLQDATSFL